MSSRFQLRQILALVALLTLVALTAAWGVRWLEVDACLDRGGRWDAAERRCEP
jgi:hypothetical protein